VLFTPGPGDRPLIALAYALMIGVPVGVGLWAWRTRPDNRFGRLLVAAGFLWFIPTLAASSNEVVYSAGWVGAWLVQPLLFVVMLAFPTGRLTTRLDRGLVLAGWALIAILYLPTALLVEEYPLPSPYAPCGLDCPANAFMVVDAEPAFVDGWLRPLRELLAVTIFAAVLVVLARRVTRASGLMRRTLAPVLAAAILLAVFFIAYFLIRRISPESPVLTAVGWLYVLCIPGIAVGFVVGLLRSQLAAGSALQRLVTRLRDHPDAGELTAVLRETMEDPTLELVYWVPGPNRHWVTAEGISVPAPATGSKRSLTEVRRENRLVAGLEHDAALNDQREFVEAAGSVALAALENQRLTAEVEASLRELSESRARIQAAADTERRRIERDLHDGAQQRLVALRVRLGLAGELMRENPARGTELLSELGTEAEDALEEVRALAHGVYPSLLADHGLGEAVRALARRSEPPPRVAVEGVGRYQPEVESAVYFCCLEALQNVAKHAQGARSVSISIRDDGELCFEVRDDGPGLPGDAVPGTGLTNMEDRLAAVGGELVVRSEPGGGGTRVVGRIPTAGRAGENGL